MNADQKLRAGLRVTIAEIVRTYCRLEQTPSGRVPTQDAIEEVKRRVAEAEMRGLLIVDDGVDEG